MSPAKRVTHQSRFKLKIPRIHLKLPLLSRLPHPPRITNTKSHNKKSRNRKLFFIIALAFLTVIGPLTFLYYQQHKEVQAGWWSQSWRFRKVINITGGSSNVTDFQVVFTLNTTDQSKFKSDCNDIRVIDFHGNELPYWIEKGNPGCNNSATRIWTKIPSIPTSGTSIFVYYGNPSAANSQTPESVFELFDDFEGNSVNTSMWKQQLTSGTGYTSVANSELYVENDVAGMHYYYNNHPIISSDHSLHVRVKNTSSTAIELFSYATNSIGSSTKALGDFTSRNYYSWTNRLIFNDIIPSDNNVYHVFQVDKISTNVNIYADNVFKISDTVSGSYLYLGSSNTSWYAYNYYDWVFIRKHISTDPIASSSGNEEISTAPLAYWKFDEGTTTTAQDSISNYDGTLSGTTLPAWQSEDQCIFGKCLYYDGTSSYVSLPSSLSDPNTFGGTTGSWTLSMWIKPNDLGTNYRTVFRRMSGMHYLAFNPGSRQLQVMVWDGISSQNAWYTSSSSINPNIWTHIAVQMKGGEGFKFYINGKLDSNNPNTNLRLTNYGTDTGLGADLGGYQYYKGFIDEVAIYPYQLTDQQMKAVYVAGKSKQPIFKTATTTLGGNRTSGDFLSDNLVGYWKMDEKSWNGTHYEITDSTGMGNHAESEGGANTVAGKFGNAGSFNGSTSYAFTSINSVQFPASSGKSGCAWIKPTAHTNSLAAVFRMEYGGGPSIRLLTDGTFSDRVANYSGTNSSAYTSPSAVPTGTWSHVCVVWESPGPNQNIKLRYYINGKIDLDATTDLSDPNGYVGISSNQGYYFGSDPDAGGRIFNGLVDEVRLYNRALTSADIFSLYNWAPGPVAHWKMDENTGTNTYDSSGNNRTGSLVNGTQWGPAKYGSGASLDGDNDAVYFDNSIPLANYKLPMTIQGWIYTGQQTESSPGIISLDKWPYGYAGITLQIGAKSGSAYQLYVHYGDGSYVYPSTPGTAQRNSKNTGYVLHENTWQHITAVINGYNNINIYINGVEVSGTYSGTAATMGWCSTMCDDTLSVLGMNWHSGSSNFKGLLDDFRVYNYARTPTQIIEDMNAGKPVTSSTSQLTYLKLDEGFGTSGKDGGSLSNHSILRNSPTWTNNGKFDKAVSLDGNNDYVELPYHSAYEYTGGDMGFSLWIYRDSAETDVARIVSKPWNGGGGYNYILLIDTNGTLQFGVGGATWWGMSTTQAIPVNTWSHVAATVKGATKKVSLYINGSLVQSGTHDITSWVPVAGNATLPLALGTLYPYGDGWGGITSFSFKGIIDEFKFSTTELTHEDVKNDFNRGSALLIGATSTTSTGTPDSSTARSYCVPGDTASCNPPIAEWKLDETTGSSVVDSSGTNLNGTWYGTTSPRWIIGKNNNAGVFNRNVYDDGDDYISFGDNDAFSPTNISISGWIHLSSPPDATSITILSKFPEWELGIDTGSTCSEAHSLFIYFGYSIVCSPIAVPVNTWTHVAITYNGSVVNIYQNGIHVKTQSNTNGVANGTAPLNMGRRSNEDYYYFNGYLDDFKLYNYVRTPAQVAWEYNKGAPVAHYRLDECQGNTIHSSTEPYISSLNGTININGSGTQTGLGSCLSGTSSNAWYNGAIGKYGNSLNFDGTDDNITIPITSTNGLNVTGPISFTAWFKRANTGTYQTIVSDISSCSNPLDGFIIRFTEGNTIMFQGYKGDPTNSNVFNAVYTDSTLWSDTTNWHHVVGTWDGTTNSNGAKIYIDGNLVGQGTSTAASFNSLSGINQMIGSLNCNAHYFAGKIDDVRIYNYALTAYQIKQVYNNGASAIFGSPSNNR